MERLFAFLGSAARFIWKRCTASDLGKDKGVGREIGRDVLFLLILFGSLSFFPPFSFAYDFRHLLLVWLEVSCKTSSPFASFGYDCRMALSVSLFMFLLYLTADLLFSFQCPGYVIRARISYVCVRLFMVFTKGERTPYFGISSGLILMFWRGMFLRC